MRGDNDYPVTIASSFPNADRSASTRTLAQGIPTIVAAEPEHAAACRWIAARPEYTPEVGNVDRGYVQTWNVAFERRLPFDIAVDVAYVGAKGDRRLRRARHQRAADARRRQPASRPYFIQPVTRAASTRSTPGAQRLKTDYHSLQVALNKPFTHGLLFKGAYTLSKSMNESDNDGRATLTWNTPSELHRNWAPAGFDRRHNFQLGFAYALPWQSNGAITATS